MNMEKLFIDEATRLMRCIENGELKLGQTELGNGIEKTQIFDSKDEVVGALAQNREEDTILINSDMFNIVLFLKGEEISTTTKITFNRLLDSSLKKIKK